jgi:hypothetical protein
MVCNLLRQSNKYSGFNAVHWENMCQCTEECNITAKIYITYRSKEHQTPSAGSKIMAASGVMFPAYLVSVQALVFAERVMLFQGIFRTN